MPAVHPIAGLGFGSAAESYERGRPSWAPEALALLEAELELAPGRRVVDVAAGTGKLTRLLLPSGAMVVAVAAVVAVEPVAGMATVLGQVVPEVALAMGVAERLPFRSGSLDAVVVAEAFHWFQVEEALAEVARVVRPGGGLAMLWNRADEEPSPWQVELGELLAGLRGELPFSSGSSAQAWTEVVAAAGAFTPLQRRFFPHRQAASVEEVVAGALSTSWVAVRPQDEREAFAGAVRVLLAGREVPLEVRWRSEVRWCHLR